MCPTFASCYRESMSTHEFLSPIAVVWPSPSAGNGASTRADHLTRRVPAIPPRLTILLAEYVAQAFRPRPKLPRVEGTRLMTRYTRRYPHRGQTMRAADDLWRRIVQKGSADLYAPTESRKTKRRGWGEVVTFLNTRH